MRSSQNSSIKQVVEHQSPNNNDIIPVLSQFPMRFVNRKPSIYAGIHKKQHLKNNDATEDSL